MNELYRDDVVHASLYLNLLIESTLYSRHIMWQAYTWSQSINQSLNKYFDIAQLNWNVWIASCVQYLTTSQYRYTTKHVSLSRVSWNRPILSTPLAAAMMTRICSPLFSGPPETVRASKTDRPTVAEHGQCLTPSNMRLISRRLNAERRALSTHVQSIRPTQSLVRLRRLPIADWCSSRRSRDDRRRAKCVVAIVLRVQVDNDRYD